MSYFAVLDNNFDLDGSAWVFENPVEFVTLNKNENAERALESLEAFRKNGYFLVGSIAYEFGSMINDAFTSHIHKNDQLVLCFGVFKDRRILSNDELDVFLLSKCGPVEPFLANVSHGIEESDYLLALDKIKAYLESGDTYQVNFTFPTYFELGGCLTRFYTKLRAAQPVKYGAYLKFPDMTVLSRSPELFFTKRDNRIETHPMKGTLRRDLDNPQHDEILKGELKEDPKQRAENLMIVDLLRNDLSRIAQKGSVTVDALFEVESFPTVHQMISRISAQINPEMRIAEILSALFPCGSITGAPKVRTSQIITELENTPRGIYTGAIGYITPKNDMGFSVPIRTVEVGAKRKAKMGIGSGVVYDSVGGAEFDECLLKGKFLFSQKPDFKLLESFYYSPLENARNEAEHLNRLKASAESLGFLLDISLLKEQLSQLYVTVSSEKRIRIELSAAGNTYVEAIDIVKNNHDEPTFIVSDVIVNGDDPIYQHKTSSRDLYNAEFQRALNLGAADVLFFNREGHLTEGAIHNVFLRFGDQLKTPKLLTGLLPGIGRAKLIAEHQVSETDLTMADLLSADEVLLVSSTRGVISAQLQF